MSTRQSVRGGIGTSPGGRRCLGPRFRLLSPSSGWVSVLQLSGPTWPGLISVSSGSWWVLPLAPEHRLAGWPHICSRDCAFPSRLSLLLFCQSSARQGGMWHTHTRTRARTHTFINADYLLHFLWEENPLCLIYEADFVRVFSGVEGFAVLKCTCVCVCV